MAIKSSLFFFVLLVVAATTYSCEKIDLTPSSPEGSLITPPFDSAENLEVHDLLDVVNDSISFLALGDSYTIGASISPAGRWPVVLAERLSQFPEMVVESPTIIATTGWTTANLSNAMTNNGVDEDHYDLVSLLIGVNNQYQGLSIESYAEQFTDLLERAIAIAGDSSRVFVVSIPDYGYTPFGLGNQASISASLEQFNQVCFDITTSYGVKHYNITPISQQWPETPGLVANDGLHPSAEQYSLWVEFFLDDIREQLR